MSRQLLLAALGSGHPSFTSSSVIEKWVQRVDSGNVVTCGWCDMNHLTIPPREKPLSFGWITVKFPIVPGGFEPRRLESLVFWVRIREDICGSRICSPQNSPGRIRTAVNGSKGHYDWPLHHGTALTSFVCPVRLASLRSTRHHRTASPSATKATSSRNSGGYLNVTQTVRCENTRARFQSACPSSTRYIHISASA